MISGSSHANSHSNIPIHRKAAEKISTNFWEKYAAGLSAGSDRSVSRDVDRDR